MSAAAAIGLVFPIAEKVLPALFGKLATNFGGKRAGELAERMTGGIVESLGGEGAIETMPEPQIVEHVTRYVEENSELIEVHLAYLDTLQTDAKSDNNVARLWRPLNGIAFAVNCVFLVWSFC